MQALSCATTSRDLKLSSKRKSTHRIVASLGKALRDQAVLESQHEGFKATWTPRKQPFNA